MQCLPQIKVRSQAKKEILVHNNNQFNKQITKTQVQQLVFKCKMLMPEAQVEIRVVSRISTS